MPTRQKLVSSYVEPDELEIIDRVARARKWSRASTVRYLVVDAASAIVEAEGLAAPNGS